nr:putative fbd-associated f-box protein [Quercus suber]
MVNIFGVYKPLLRWLMKLVVMRPQTVEIKPGTVMNFWVPNETPNKSKNSNNNKAVVFIHGFAADGIITWQSQVLALARKYKVYVPDLLFFGGSITDRSERSPEFQAECVAKGLKKPSVERCTLVGLSYGGMVGFKMAEMYPDLVESMVLTCSAMALTKSISDAALERIGFKSWSDYTLPDSVQGVKILFDIATFKLPFSGIRDSYGRTQSDSLSPKAPHVHESFLQHPVTTAPFDHHPHGGDTKVDNSQTSITTNLNFVEDQTQSLNARIKSSNEVIDFIPNITPSVSQFSTFKSHINEIDVALKKFEGNNTPLSVTSQTEFTLPIIVDSGGDISRKDSDSINDSDEKDLLEEIPSGDSDPSMGPLVPLYHRVMEDSSTANGEDWISRLPDSILCHILSFLSPKEAIGTSILSKRWENPWTSVPSLYFCDTFMTDCGQLPWCLLTCKTLVVLKIHGRFVLNFPTLICLPRLKFLYLNSVIYGDDASMQKLFSSCPVLEDLVIKRHDWDGVRIMNISVPSLKRLSIFSSSLRRIGNYEYKVVINTPNLEYLETDDYMYEDYSVNSSPSLVEACIQGTCVFGLLDGISQVKLLALSGDAMQSLHNIVPILPTFHNLTHLKLGIDDNVGWELLPNILQSSPNLKVLNFKEGLVKPFNKGTFQFSWNPPRCVPNCLLLHLKTIEIHNFLGTPDEKA